MLFAVSIYYGETLLNSLTPVLPVFPENYAGRTDFAYERIGAP